MAVKLIATGQTPESLFHADQFQMDVLALMDEANRSIADEDDASRTAVGLALYRLAYRVRRVSLSVLPPTRFVHDPPTPKEVAEFEETAAEWWRSYQEGTACASAEPAAWTTQPRKTTVTVDKTTAHHLAAHGWTPDPRAPPAHSSAKPPRPHPRPSSTQWTMPPQKVCKVTAR